ncbi:hypothetical protein U1Q18_022792, partial [Sarracenia purpurea var. burkii]
MSMGAQELMSEIESKWRDTDKDEATMPKGIEKPPGVRSSETHLDREGYHRRWRRIVGRNGGALAEKATPMRGYDAGESTKRRRREKVKLKMREELGREGFFRERERISKIE